MKFKTVNVPVNVIQSMIKTLSELLPEEQAKPKKVKAKIKKSKIDFMNDISKQIRKTTMEETYGNFRINFLLEREIIERVIDIASDFIDSDKEVYSDDTFIYLGIVGNDLQQFSDSVNDNLYIYIDTSQVDSIQAIKDLTIADFASILYNIRNY